MAVRADTDKPSENVGTLVMTAGSADAKLCQASFAKVRRHGVLVCVVPGGGGYLVVFFRFFFFSSFSIILMASLERESSRDQIIALAIGLCFRPQEVES